MKNGETCAECGCVVDETKPGFGHRGAPSPCGKYTFTVAPDLGDYFESLGNDEKPSLLSLMRFRADNGSAEAVDIVRILERKN